MAVETGAVAGEGGEVGLGSAAAEAVVGCGPGWGEPGSVSWVRKGCGWRGGSLLGGCGERKRSTWLSRRGRRG